jgi:hypothetical protein
MIPTLTLLAVLSIQVHRFKSSEFDTGIEIAVICVVVNVQVVQVRSQN